MAKTTNVTSIKPVQPDPPITRDTLQNLTKGLGSSRDPVMATHHTFRQRMSHIEAEALYLNDWLGAAVIDAIPDDMVREGRDIKGLTDDQLKAFETAERDFETWEHLSMGLKWGRLYGGGGVVLGLDGTGEMHEPLDMERIKPGALKWITTLDRYHLIPELAGLFNPLQPGWDKPEFYRAFSGPDRIHRSRILFFKGVKLPYRLAIRNWFWGASVLERVADAIRDAGIAQHGIASLILEAKVDVFKIPGLFHKLLTDEGTEEIKARVQLAQEGKGYLNALLMDKEEEWEQKTDALSGQLHQLLAQFLEVVAGAAGIPVTRLLGKSPTGLSNGGEENTRNYYDHVKKNQNESLSPPLRILDEVLLRTTLGEVPPEFESKFKSLWMQSEEDRSTTQLQDSDRDIKFYQEGIILPHHIAGRLLRDQVYPDMDSQWVKELESASEGISRPGDEPEPPPPGEDPDAPEGPPAPADPDPDPATDT